MSSPPLFLSYFLPALSIKSDPSNYHGCALILFATRHLFSENNAWHCLGRPLAWSGAGLGGGVFCFCCVPGRHWLAGWRNGAGWHLPVEREQSFLLAALASLGCILLEHRSIPRKHVRRRRSATVLRLHLCWEVEILRPLSSAHHMLCCMLCQRLFCG